MIEIVLDGNKDDKFCNKQYPIINIAQENKYDWNSYKKYAKDLINQYSNEEAIIFKLTNKNFSLNKFALALFIMSCQLPNSLECAVFKVDNLQKAREDYKPCVACTVAIKYILRLLDGTIEQAYRDISGLGYLGIKVNRNYSNNILKMDYLGEASLPNIIKTDNFDDAIVAAATLKALCLQKAKVSISVEIKMNNIISKKTPENLIDNLLEQINTWTN